MLPHICLHIPSSFIIFLTDVAHIGIEIAIAIVGVELLMLPIN